MLEKQEISEDSLEHGDFSLEPEVVVKEEKDFLDGTLSEVTIKKEVDNFELDDVKVEICEYPDIQIKTEENLLEDPIKYEEGEEFQQVKTDVVKKINEEVRTFRRKVWTSLISNTSKLAGTNEENNKDKACLRCDECLLNFESEEDLIVHKQNHSHSYFQCTECNQLFERSFSLKIHQASHGTFKRYKCDICCKSFTRRYTLKDHLLSHSGENPYQCDVCKKFYRSKIALASHVRYHVKVKKYECPVCKKLFLQPCGLREHMVKHKNAKNYKCDVCSKYYSYLSLKRHLKSHFGTVRHPCDECNKCFKQNSSLLCHKRSKHLGLKPYKCEDCDKAFTKSRGLRLHMNKHRVLQIQNTIEIVNQKDKLG